jgi:pimeloyl-ACP methyl ester carboxylesterase
MAQKQIRNRSRENLTAVADRPADGAQARARLLSDLDVRERRLSLGGVSTAVLEGGRGRPLVLLHGPGAYGLAWRRVIPELIATHRVIAPDLPGHGESDMFAGALDTGRLMAWLGDLIEQTCPEPPVLAGHALGGAVAARFAAEHGERLAALVLIDALGLTDFQPAPEFGQALSEYLSSPTQQTLDGLWAQCAYDFPALRAGMGDLWEPLNAYTLERVRAPGGLPALRDFMARVGVPALPRDVLARIAVPTTLIWGRRDRAIPLRVAEDASARFGWRLNVIEDSADDPALEQPAAFLRALRGALPRPEPASR